MLRLFGFIIFALMSIGVKAQEPEYVLEVGVGGGMSWSYTDVNRDKVLYNPTFAAEVMLRYNLNPRWSFVADLSNCGVKGDSWDTANTFIGGEHYTFDNRLWQLCVRPEFHYWNYGWSNDYREKKHIVPFLTAGLGFGYSTGDGETGLVGCLPFGGGFKWKVRPRFNLQLTCLFTRMLGDKADGIRDPYCVWSSSIANGDWVGSLVLSMTFDFKERCNTCLNKNY